MSWGVRVQPFLTITHYHLLIHKHHVAGGELEEVHLLAEQVELVVLRLLERLVRPVVVRRRVNLPGQGGGLSGFGPEAGANGGLRAGGVDNGGGRAESGAPSWGRGRR